MRYYIAGKAGDDAQVKEMHRLMQARGHVPTVDWTKFGNMKPYGERQKESREGALACMRGVRDSDLCILFPTPEHGPGKFIEFGAAIATNEATGKPVIYVVDNSPNRSMFYYHPAVRIRQTKEDVLGEI